MIDKVWKNPLILFLLIAALFADCDTQSKRRVAKLEAGNVYHGFTFVKEKEVEEYAALVRLFEHKKSGARLIKVETDDDNKTFAIAFKTPPRSDSGTPHILEHSVLNGSKNFPVKSPFDVMAKSSLRTFINAMTASDMTVYPVSSRNHKDYLNLMHVYLDAVFFPLIYDDPRIFKQEGWHYELDSADAELTIKGVVYNEMKGAFSSPTRELDYVVSQGLFPDTGYGFSSGGYPPAIPSLTYERFLDFHRRYYHPANSYIMVYGDHDLMKELEFIDREYLSKFDKIEVDSTIRLQEPFEEMKVISAEYPIPESGSEADQTYLNLSFVTGLGKDRELAMAMNILSSALVNQPGTPIRRALQDAGIGKEVRGYADDTKQSVFSLTVEKANPGDRDRFREVVFSTLRKVAAEGLDKRVVEGLINRMEFQLREPRSGYQGLMVGILALNGWMYADDPFLTIGYKAQLEGLREKLKTDYLEKIIREKLIDNPHSLLTVLEPRKGLMEAGQQQLREELADYRATLSEEQIRELVAQTEALREFQQTPDSREALDKMPLLTLEDIKARTDYFRIEPRQEEGVRFLTYPTFANDIVYARMIFDARVIPQEMIPYVSLLSEVLGKLNTKNYSYGDLDTEINIHTGGIRTDLVVYQEDRDLEKIRPKFVIEGKVMNYKIPEFLKLCREIAVNSKINDPVRLREVLTRHQANLEARIERNGLGVAMDRLASYYSNSGQYDEQRRGLTYYRFVTGLVNNYEENSSQIIKNLLETAGTLFKKSNLEIAVTASDKDLDRLIREISLFTGSLLEGSSEMSDYSFDFTAKNEGITSASKVQYVVQGYDFKKLGYDYTGHMVVMNQILSRDYLHEKIRVMGGAYGGFSGLSGNGTVYFGSYRDPNLQQTLEHYQNAAGFLESFTADDTAMTRHVIGTMARYERPYTAQMKGESALENYYENISEEQVQRIRQEILSTTPADIRELAKMVSEIIGRDYYCVYGNESRMREAEELFTSLIPARQQ